MLLSGTPASASTLRPVAATFGAFGAFWGAWAVAAADVERGLRVSHSELGLLLSTAVGLGGLAAAATGGLAERAGTARTLAGALGVWGGACLVAATVPSRVGLAVAFGAAMVGAGLVDMAMNAAATAGVGGDAVRMIRFHALFNAGALAGAGVTGALEAGGLSWRGCWGAVGLVGLGLAVAARRSPLPGGAPGPSRHQRARRVSALRAFAAVRRARLTVLAAAFAATAVVEGGIDTWGVLYLRRHLATGVLVGAAAYAVGQAIAVTTRTMGAPLAGRLGARWGLVLGAGGAGLGLALEAAAPDGALAACGLALAAGGIALCWPLVMAVLGAVGAGAPPEPPGVLGGAASRGEPPATGSSAPALVGAFTAAGYLGWVVAPLAVGWLATRAGLGAGLSLLAALALGTAAVLSGVPAARRAS